MTTLYHYTCDHGAAGIERSGMRLVPPARPPRLIWLTDLDAPARRALGLTSRILACDRTRNRFIVPDPTDVAHWPDVRRSLPAEWVRTLEDVEGVMPMHWWITRTPQHVTLGT